MDGRFSEGPQLPDGGGKTAGLVSGPCVDSAAIAWRRREDRAVGERRHPARVEIKEENDEKLAAPADENSELLVFFLDDSTATGTRPREERSREPSSAATDGAGERWSLQWCGVRRRCRSEVKREGALYRA
jgi:hypothetical protein